VVFFDNIKVVKPVYYQHHHQPQLIPDKISNDLLQSSNHINGHLKWIATKYVLKQDIFLIGSAGSLRRKLIYLFCKLIGAEVELFVITRDTIEADLRQRKEIVDDGKSTFYADSCIVKAAIHGRVLILDGIEKAERNVLPTLNNLLENREMPLDDGRCLLSPKKYDALVNEIGVEEVRARRLERVSENFQIVALGLPVPPYVGHALDPPLRSRFQGRVVDVPMDLMGLDSLRVDSYYHMTYDAMEGISQQLHSLHYLTRGYTAEADAADQHSIPRLPYDSLIRLKNVLYQRINSDTIIKKTSSVKTTPHPPTTTSASTPARMTIDVDTLQRYYPFHHFEHSAMRRVQSALVHLGIGASTADADTATTLSATTAAASGRVVVTPSGYVETREIRQLISDIKEDWQLGHDICIIGDTGGGKTAFVTHLLSSIKLECIPPAYTTSSTTTMIHEEVESMFLYQDMSARDLLEHRSTDVRGNTTWHPSSLVRAAMEGKVLILDGIDRLASDALCILAPLIQDRRLALSGRCS
jgi:MoxR-like ATPase